MYKIEYVMFKKKHIFIDIQWIMIKKKSLYITKYQVVALIIYIFKYKLTNLPMILIEILIIQPCFATKMFCPTRLLLHNWLRSLVAPVLLVNINTIYKE